MQSENVNELFTALSKAQGEMTVAVKNNTNPHFKSRFADLQSYFSACREPLSKYGLALIQTIDEIEGRSYLMTTLAHSSGQWIKSKMPINPTKNDMQGFGSALSYAKRYSLGAIIGLASGDEDDDAQEAVRETERPFKSISPDQCAELMKLINECDKDFSEKVQEHLKESGYKDFTKIPETLYKGIKKRAIEEMSKKKEMANGTGG